MDVDVDIDVHGDVYACAGVYVDVDGSVDVVADACVDTARHMVACVIGCRCH